MRHSALFALLLFSLTAALAVAQQPPGQGAAGPAAQPQAAVNPVAPPSYPPLFASPFGDDHLLGDWGGARTWLADRGINLGLNYITETAGIVSGGQKRGVDYSG